MTDDDGLDGLADIDPTSKLLREAIAMHEILTTLLRAGWTERQAIIYIVELGFRQNHE